MMNPSLNTNIRELYVSYPFLPESSVDDAVKNIRDIRILVGSDFSNHSRKLKTISGDCLVAKLVAITQTALAISVTSTEYGITNTYSVPIYTGIDSNVIYGDTATRLQRSYAILDKPVTSTVLTHQYRLHPDCIEFATYTGPNVYINGCTCYSIKDSYKPTGAMSLKLEDGTFLSNGHHIALSYSEGQLNIAESETGGLGYWTWDETPPAYTECPNYTYSLGSGLSTICGMTGDIVIKGKGYVSVDTYTEQAMEGDFAKVITVELDHK